MGGWCWMYATLLENPKYAPGFWLKYNCHPSGVVIVIVLCCNFLIIEKIYIYFDLGKNYLDFMDVLKVMATITDDHDEVVKQAFHTFDKDGNGVISHHEFVSQVKKCQADITDDEISEMFKSADINGNGEIDIQGY